MKHIELEYRQIKNNLRANRKHVLIIFLLCIVLGVIIGWLDKRKTEKKAEDTRITEDVGISQIKLDGYNKDETYFYLTYMDLKEKDSALNAYVQYLKQVDLSGESLNSVSIFEEKMVLYDKNIYSEIKEYYYTFGPIILNESTEDFVKERIEISQMKVELAEQGIDTLDKSLTKYFDTREKEIVFNQYIYAEKDLTFWEKQFEKIETIDIYEQKNINNKMSLLLEGAVRKINELIYDFNLLIQEIEKREQYDIVYNRYLLNQHLEEAGMIGELEKDDIVDIRKEKALIYARSISGVDEQKERFFSIMTFFFLLGITLSVLYGSIRKTDV